MFQWASATVRDAPRLRGAARLDTCRSTTRRAVSEASAGALLDERCLRQAPTRDGEDLSGYSTDLNDSAARNFTTLDAGMVSALPVCGLRPLRALRFPTVNEPNPESWTPPLRMP